MTDARSTTDDPLGLGGTYRDRMRQAQDGQPAGAVTADPAGDDPKSPANPDDAENTDDTENTEDESTVEKAKSLAARLKEKPWIDHLIKAGGRYTDRLGNQFAGAITYFSFLAVVPVLMVAFSVATFVLRDNTAALNELKDKASEQIPGPMTDKIIESAINSGLSIGLIGLVVALYSGVNWMSYVRDAVHAQWRIRWQKAESEKTQKIYVRYAKDLLTLVGLGVGMLISLVLTTVGGAAQSLVLGWLGLDGVSWLKPVFSVVPFLLAIVASSLVFGWFYRMMQIPEYTPTRRTLIKGAVAAAVGFEVLKVAMTFLIPKLSNSPTFVAFGAIIVLLFFFNLMARLVLFVAAWIGTAPGILASGQDQELPEIPGPSVVVHDEGRGRIRRGCSASVRSPDSWPAAGGAGADQRQG